MCVQCAPYLHGMDYPNTSKSRLRIRWPTLDALARTTSNFWTLDLFVGKSYQNHCLVSCVIFSASQPFYRLKKGATAQTVNDLWSYLINECQIVTQSKCPMCKKDFCFQCKTPCMQGTDATKVGNQEISDQNDVVFGKLIEEKKWVM